MPNDISTRNPAHLTGPEELLNSGSQTQLSYISRRILEPAVGSGRILIPLMQAGHVVDGTDTSPTMLETCRSNCEMHGIDAVLIEADMSTYVNEDAYEAVIVPTGSLMLLDGLDATHDALVSFRRCLKPGGRLIVDIAAPELIPEIGSMRSWRVDDDLWTLTTDHLESDSSKNQTTRWLRYEKWHDGQLMSSELQLFRLQWWSVGEFSRVVREAGFSNVEVHADYQIGKSPGPESDIWTFTAIVA
ncbi:MAG: class I SAM-dependent methyltransferase [Actinomycetota bacterium]|nr:class I SAM-dependent methyltransferase [Actinomycetota bacterium]